MQQPGYAVGTTEHVGVVAVLLVCGVLETGAALLGEDVAHVEAGICAWHGFGGETYGFADVVGFAGVGLAVWEEGDGEVAISANGVLAT